MILEKNLTLPILQVNCGCYSSAAEISLAVLHSRKLSVYTVNSTKEFSQLNKVYEHEFNRNAYNFTSGAFGGSHKEVICVQSVDGALFFFK